jgi:hypothetical protein
VLAAIAMAGLLAACEHNEAGTPARVETKAEPAPTASRSPAPALPEPPPIGDAPLENGKPSLAALGQAVVEALDTKDAKTLWALTVSEQEYRRLFGALVSHPNMLRFGPEMAWANQREDNRDGLDHAIDRYGGKGYELVSLEPTRTEERRGLVVYRAPKLTVKDSTGATLELGVIGVAVEHVASRTFLVLTFAD